MKIKKNKILAFIIFLSFIILFGIPNVSNNIVSAANTTASIGTIAQGEVDPNSYGYNSSCGGFWEARAKNSMPLPLPTKGGSPIYCTQHGIDSEFDINAPGYKEIQATEGKYAKGDACPSLQPAEGTLSTIGYTASGSGSLPPVPAYIISGPGGWSADKQRGLWNLSAYSGGLVGVYGHSANDGPSSYDAEGKAYYTYDSQVRGKGLQPQDATSSVSVFVNQSNKTYTVGPFKLNYTNGIYGGVAFSGISDMYVWGYNTGGGLVRGDSNPIKIKSFIIGGKEVTPEFFEPDSNKVDRTKQVYPEPNQEFYIVFSDPNGGLSYDDSNRVARINVKVKFKYMLAYGKYTKYRGEMLQVNHNHDHDVTIVEGETEGEKTTEITCTRKIYLSRINKQGQMCADAVRTIYEQELIIGGGSTGGKFDITMEIGGNVWEDDRGGKESLPDGIGSEKAVSGIPVILYEEDGTKVAETTTDGSGEYKFEDLDAMRKYYVEFQYNGQTYENTLYNPILSGNYSNATESMADRDAFNAKFEEIDGDGGYSLGQLENYTPDSPFAISAYTGSDGLNGLVVYPIYDQFVIGEQDQTINGTKYEAIYQVDDSQKEVDFGITKRIEFDMAVKKDVFIATVKINGKTEVYGYDKKNIEANDGSAGDSWNISVVGGYDRPLDDADYNFTGQNGNNQLLEVYVTYKIAVRNQSQSMLGHVTKLYDYYDSSYEYKEELSWKSDKSIKASTDTLNSLQNSMEAGSTASWGQSVGASAGGGKLTIDVGKKQATGETVYLYLTFKVNGEGPNLSLGTKTNAIEIGAFKTYYAPGTVLPHYGTNSYTISGDSVIAGRVDRDSIPSNGKNGEDDYDEAPGLNVHLTGDSRKLNGNVWEDERTENLSNSIIGNGLKDNGEKGIAGIKVELVEKTVQGNEYKWFETKTDSNGNYNFDGYIAGDYVIRFNYGDSNDTVATKVNGGLNDVSYNGQDFKSTSYQVGVTQPDYTHIDANKYKGYKDIQNQNETGTYGYDIAASFGKNVSDAKDIESRREAVNNYSKNNVKNNVGEVLASPYSGRTDLLEQLIEKTSMVAETGVIVVEVEYNKQSNQENGNPSYSIKDIDFGLEERPKAQLEINKEISNVKVTLANTSVQFDVNKGFKVDNLIWKQHEEYRLNYKADGNKKLFDDVQKYRDYYAVEGKHRYSYRDEINTNILGKADNGLIQITMDEELMHGATIQITYKVKVTNVGEIDYNSEEFYYTGVPTGSIVTTNANQVVDYVKNNLQFSSGNTLNKDAKWQAVVSNESLITDGYVYSTYADKVKGFNTIITTKGLEKELTPGESIEKTLVLSQLITTENEEDDLIYTNMVEIIETSNTVGRRMAYSIVGNQDPTAQTASEVDASMAEKVIILPPFGNTHIQYILIAVVGIILAGGITLIIRKVMKK